MTHKFTRNNKGLLSMFSCDRYYRRCMHYRVWSFLITFGASQKPTLCHVHRHYICILPSSETSPKWIHILVLKVSAPGRLNCTCVTHTCICVEISKKITAFKSQQKYGIFNNSSMYCQLGSYLCPLPFPTVDNMFSSVSYVEATLLIIYFSSSDLTRVQRKE